LLFYTCLADGDDINIIQGSKIIEGLKNKAIEGDISSIEPVDMLIDSKWGSIGAVTLEIG
jgi:hypothetical protein